MENYHSKYNFIKSENLLQLGFAKGSLNQPNKSKKPSFMNKCEVKIHKMKNKTFMCIRYNLYLIYISKIQGLTILKYIN